MSVHLTHGRVQFCAVQTHSRTLAIRESKLSRVSYSWHHCTPHCSGTEFFLATKQRIIVSVCLISATAWPASSAWLVARVLVWPVLFARSCLSLLHSSVVCISHSIIIQPALVFVLFSHQSSFSLQLHTRTAPRICFCLGTRNCGYTFLS